MIVVISDWIGDYIHVIISTVLKILFTLPFLFIKFPLLFHNQNCIARSSILYIISQLETLGSAAQQVIT